MAEVLARSIFLPPNFYVCVLPNVPVYSQNVVTAVIQIVHLVNEVVVCLIVSPQFLHCT